MTGKDETIVLVLQGGGALGAYQAGAYEALADAGYEPAWVAGISIGSINAALIAGNPPAQRVDCLRAFWEGVSARLVGEPKLSGSDARTFFNEASAALVATMGVPGFFAPRFPPAILMPPGSPEAISVYDTAPLRATLEALVDFDVLNRSPMRLSVGATNIATGNFAYFDTEDQQVGIDHVMASGALPPGFPPIMIDGQAYWDGGLVSNTPLQYVLEASPEENDLCIFQIDLFSARGPLPRTLLDVAQREKDIRFSSRTRLNTDRFQQLFAIRRAAHRLTAKLPEAMHNDPDALFLDALGVGTAVTIVHLIHRRAAYETQSKDYEFSRLSMEEHWEAGISDVRRTLRDRAWRHRKRPEDGIAIFDLAGDDGF